MPKWPEMIVFELLLGCAAGALLSKGEGRHVRPLALGLAIIASLVITFMLMLAWWSDLLPFDLPLGSWYSLMTLMGIYEASGFLASAILVPWAPLRIRAKVFLAVLSAAIVVGHLTYGGGDLMMMPTVEEHAGYFCSGAALPTAAAAIGHLGKRAMFRNE